MDILWWTAWVALLVAVFGQFVVAAICCGTLLWFLAAQCLGSIRRTHHS